MAHQVEIPSEAAHGTRRRRPWTVRLRRAQLVALRSFLLKVGINTLVLALMLPMMPGLLVHNAQVWSYLGIGLTLSLFNRILKPVLLVFNGHLILWHRLAWQTVAVTIVLLLAFIMSGVEVTFVELHWVIIDAVLLGLALTLADALLGFDRPQVTPDSRQRSIWRLADRFPGLRRSRLLKQLRLAQVYEIVWSYGIEIALGRSPIRPIRARISYWITGRASPLDRMTVPQKVTTMLEQLGPLYVKLGQVVSSQSASLPEEWRAELDKLQSTVAPFPYAEARAVIRAELGAPPEQLFATFDETPLAAASTAQVHRATLKDGSRGRGQGAASGYYVQSLDRPADHARAGRQIGAPLHLGARAGPQRHRRRVCRRCDARAGLPQRGVSRRAPGRRDVDRAQRACAAGVP